ncbi:MAG: CRISPR-associated helicase/endonuclease Cas3 [Gammaproteobacteria bacterium]|nr:MAG: CRISPR-associated helicase/endonuclease Cas3 [Gammaproteobacteria bacterium]
MIVTFISQCQKKANRRTRRVLDAFANRIGTNTWQTPITEEGLDAIKKLLRKTASKNTAISCHKIKSRQLTELVWIVGNKNKFNNEGIVPVNYTEQDFFIGENNMSKVYANTNKQPLDQHLFAVGVAAYNLCKEINIINSDKEFDENFAKAIFIAGCWHDMGKIDPFYSTYLKKQIGVKGVIDKNVPDGGQHNEAADKNYPRHNESSLLFFHLSNNQKFPNEKIRKYVEYAIYWHHDRWSRGFENNKLRVFELYQIYAKISKKVNSDFTKLFNNIKEIIKNINLMSNTYFDNPIAIDDCLSDCSDEIESIDDTLLPEYKKYKSRENKVTEYHSDIANNARNNIIRTIIVTADWLVSGISAKALNAHIEKKTLHVLLDSTSLVETNLKENIKKCLKEFNDRKNADKIRNKKQTQAAKELNNKVIGILNGPAGCGKTKIALEWASNTNAKQIIWICPRVQICQGLKNDLISGDYLPSAKIEICTGEEKIIYQNGGEIEVKEGEEFSGDIVLTTIDQVLNTITTHNKVTKLVQYMNAHVVFDEYHEYIQMTGFNLLFAELVECKKLQNKNNTLLVSATPNFYFIENLLNLKSVVNFESFNKSKYKIIFQKFDKLEEQNNPFYQKQENGNTIVISNTATTAQLSFIKNQNEENSILFHSKFKQDDKKELFNKIRNSFKKDGNKNYDVLRSGPAVQASLNITCNKMISEFTNAENWLQRMGRLDRFGENSEPNLYISAIVESKTGILGSMNDSFLRGKLYCLQSAKAWFEFLNKKLPENRIVTISEIYQVYQEFYKDEVSRKFIKQDLIDVLKDSARLIEAKIIPPVAYGKKYDTKTPKDKKIRIKNNSLRGNNRFVQMAIININDNKIEYSNEYMYNEQVGCVNGLTLDIDIIDGLDFFGEKNPDKDLLSNMFKNHYKILSDKTGKKVKKPRSLSDYKANSRMIDKPIYVSYTPDDLSRLGGNDKKPNSYAIYYAIGKNQPIGAISIYKLMENNNDE